MDHLRRLGRGPIIAAAAAVALALGLAAWLLLGQGTAQQPLPSPSQTMSSAPSPSPSPSPSASEAVGVACPLNGLPVDDPALLDRVAIAVQVENNLLARPQRNLSNADMVVEAPVEGNTTRFSAIFLCRPTVGLTGPIRSARYYEIDLWQDLGVLPVGFGASTEALRRFSAVGMPYVNGITGSWPWFKRSGTNRAPHNLYGDMEALRAALGGGGGIDRLAAKVGPLRPPFTFDEGAVLPTGRPVTAIEIRTNPSWRFGWSWRVSDAVWSRQDAGKEVVDEVTGELVTATHVLVQRVVEEVVSGDPDPGGNPRRLQHLVGEGDGTLYTAGRAIALHWSRPTASDGTRWTYADSSAPIVLPPGVVWWEIIPIAAPLTES
ncbi:MAG: DUF3048 domain-containing protein [Chloroflexota bacterium]|nr:DUF3048 domain-containing protein [Chloroflexota bacterium]